MDQQWKAVAATSVLSPWSLKSLSKKIASLAIGCWMNHCSRWLFFFFLLAHLFSSCGLTGLVKVLENSVSADYAILRRSAWCFELHSPGRAPHSARVLCLWNQAPSAQIPLPSFIHGIHVSDTWHP